MKEHSEHIVKTCDVINKSVYNNENEKLGKIEEIVLDKMSGQAHYIVLSFDTFMGFGGKFFAFPWKPISYHNEKNGFILNVSKEDLDAKNGFDKDNWPDMAQADWQDKVNNYYDHSFEPNDV